VGLRHGTLDGANENPLLSVAILKHEPLPPRFGKRSLGLVQRFGKAVGGQARRNDGASYRPHPGAVLRRAAAAKDAANGAPLAQHVVIVRAASGCAAITSAAEHRRHRSIQVAVCASIAAMARKAKLPTDRATEQADFKSWLALQREHNTNPAIIPVRIWRHLYIQGRAPQEAAAQAAVSAYNARPAADRLRDRKR
jgi:hypothetical protein